MPTTDELTSAFSAIAQEVAIASQLPRKADDYHPTRLELYFDDVLAVVREAGQTTHELQLPAQYRPDIITIYGDDELILAIAHTHVLLNRLPKAQQEWQTYVI
jgi:hypothetical protein